MYPNYNNLFAILVMLTLHGNQKSQANAADGTSDIASSRLQIHIPKNLYKKEGYDHRPANFGSTLEGGSISQMVYYAASDLCDPNVDTHVGFPTRPKDDNGNMKSWPSPHILMVDRGSCSFVTQVRNAQRSGAAGVIIADNACLCSAGNTCTSDSNIPCQVNEPVVADDGSGNDISIPAFLMLKQDADLVKDELRIDHTVQMEMAWGIPTRGGKVAYHLWTMPTDLVSQSFQKTFKEAAVALGEGAYFTPHMYILDGKKSNCLGLDGEEVWCLSLCTNHGRYCAMDPDYDLDDGISGYGVVVESLRRICIWKHYGEEDGVGAEWWDYAREFNDHCNSVEHFADEKCVRKSMSESGINWDVVAQCIEDSGGVDKNQPNVLLEAEIARKEEMGVVIIPAAFVNNKVIRGYALTSTSVFHNICEGHVPETAPQICQECASCTDQNACISQGHCGAHNRFVSMGLLLGCMVCLAVFFGIALLLRERQSRQQMREHVRGLLAEYIPLEEDDKVDREIA